MFKHQDKHKVEAVIGIPTLGTVANQDQINWWTTIAELLNIHAHVTSAWPRFTCTYEARSTKQ